MDGFVRLAHAIVVQAAKDWQTASGHPKSKKAKEVMAECEEFFLSEWFTELSGLDGKAVLEKLKKERAQE